MDITDALGYGVRVGDTVVYAHSGKHGASARLWHGRIDRIDFVKKKIRVCPVTPDDADKLPARWLWPQAVHSITARGWGE
jgi:hypothetical protein